MWNNSTGRSPSSIVITCIIQAVLPIANWNALFGISLDVDKGEKKEKDDEGWKRKCWCLFAEASDARPKWG